MDVDSHFTGAGRLAPPNGHILAIATFPEKNKPIEDADAPVCSNGTPFSVSAETIRKAFSRLPKVGRQTMPVESGIFVSPGKVANIARCQSDRFTIEEETDQQYPNYQQVMPLPAPDDTVLSISKENMAVLVDTMKACRYPTVTLRVPRQTRNGYVQNAVAFAMGAGYDGGGIDGLVMPWSTPDYLRNMDNPLIINEDVAEMLTMLLGLAPDNERVQYMSEKYPGLLKQDKPEPEAAE